MMASGGWRGAGLGGRTAGEREGAQGNFGLVRYYFTTDVFLRGMKLYLYLGFLHSFPGHMHKTSFTFFSVNFQKYLSCCASTAAAVSPRWFVR